MSTIVIPSNPTQATTLSVDICLDREDFKILVGRVTAALAELKTRRASKFTPPPPPHPPRPNFMPNDVFSSSSLPNLCSWLPLMADLAVAAVHHLALEMRAPPTPQGECPLPLHSPHWSNLLHLQGQRRQSSGPQYRRRRHHGLYSSSRGTSSPRPQSPQQQMPASYRGICQHTLLHKSSQLQRRQRQGGIMTGRHMIRAHSILRLHSVRCVPASLQMVLAYTLALSPYRLTAFLLWTQ